MSMLPGYLNQGSQWMNTGLSQLDGLNSQISSYINTIGNDPNSTRLQGALNDIYAGKGITLAQSQGTNATATLAGPASLA